MAVVKSLQIELEEIEPGFWVADAPWLSEVVYGKTCEEAYYEAIKKRGESK